jgi:preprotein translocase subunit Sec63
MEGHEAQADSYNSNGAARVMQQQDLYQVLGVPQDAAPDVVKRAYYKLSLQTHPDKGRLVLSCCRAAGFDKTI